MSRILFLFYFMFDGNVTSHACIYNNRNILLINNVAFLMKKVFNLKPRYWLNKTTGVHRISYHYVELANYMRKKTKHLIKHIKNTCVKEKQIFLRSFFDDEGCAYMRKNKRLIRGYQHNLEILELVKKLLKDFNIKSNIDKKYQEIIISKKENFIRFRDRINFSKGVYINPDRKNSIWKKKLEKREILNKIIISYKS